MREQLLIASMLSGGLLLLIGTIGSYYYGAYDNTFFLIFGLIMSIIFILYSLESVIT